MPSQAIVILRGTGHVLAPKPRQSRRKQTTQRLRKHVHLPQRFRHNRARDGCGESNCVSLQTESYSLLRRESVPLYTILYFFSQSAETARCKTGERTARAKSVWKEGRARCPAKKTRRRHASRLRAALGLVAVLRVLVVSGLCRRHDGLCHPCHDDLYDGVCLRHDHRHPHGHDHRRQSCSLPLPGPPVRTHR